MDKNPRTSTPITGGSSLLVIFAVLCLTVFALLTLSTVQAGSRLSQATAQAVSAYYQADCQAEEIYAQLRSDELPADMTEYSYTCPISDTQQLEVVLQKEANQWTVRRWQAVSIADWDADTDLNVWNGFE